MLTIIKPTKEKPYIIDINDPIVLRVACSAGINRSACVREYLSRRIHEHSIIYPQYGAHFGDFEKDQIIVHEIAHGDGFNEIFGTAKIPNMQYQIFKKLDIPCSKVVSIEGTHKEYHFDMDQLDHIERYKDELIELFWNIKSEGKKNVFILVNEHTDTINTVIYRLLETREPVELVLINVVDTIYRPATGDIKPQSYEAYCIFIDEISKYFSV